MNEGVKIQWVSFAMNSVTMSTELGPIYIEAQAEAKANFNGIFTLVIVSTTAIQLH